MSPPCAFSLQAADALTPKGLEQARLRDRRPPTAKVRWNHLGPSGLMYIGRKMGTASHKGGLLVGLESDSPYRMNQTGHMHNAAAQAEEGSSTGGLKVDIQGNKYGGRTVDLSGLSNKEMVATLTAFSTHFKGLRDSNEAAYNALLEQISGKRMDTASMNALLDQMLAGRENAALLAKLKQMRQSYST